YRRAFSASSLEIERRILSVPKDFTADIGTAMSWLNRNPARAPIDTFRLSIESNLLESEVTLRKGTDVIASDYNKVGTVDEIVSSHDGVISTIVARAGFLFSHDIAVPMSAVKSFGTDKIRLSISKDDAEKARR
ncbi:MAG: PRC-barrel domain-containing protein, partial [Chloroflexota bacterium]